MSISLTEFVTKWRRVALSERSASQQHFLDLCELFDHAKPAAADPTGESFTFERGIGTVRYPRLVPRNDACAAKLKPRTLTNLYNQRPTWLDLAHKKLDQAVFAAYGWSPDLTDDEILQGLLDLNLERTAGEGE